MIQTVLSLLADLGAATTDLVWLPVLTWTVLTVPLWGFLERTERLHPRAEYRLSQLLLAALPLGIAATGIVKLLPETSAPSLLPDASVLVLPPANPSTAAASGVAWGWDHAIGALTVLTLAVGIFELGRLGANAIALRRVRALVGPTSSPAWQETLDRLSDQLNVRRPVRGCTTSATAVPATLGGIEPVILVPERLTEAPDALRMTLRHELIHIRRWDDLAQCLERLVAAVFAAHPLVGRLRRRVDEARERACDAAVLADHRTPAGDYARLLAAFADGSGPERLGALSLSESPSSLRNRLSALNSALPSLLSSRASLLVALVTGGVAFIFGMVACSDPAVGPNAPPSDLDPETASQTTAATDEVYRVVEDQPKLKGGMEALYNAVSYPKTAKEAGIEGRVVVQFVVDKNGHVTNPEVRDGTHKLLNKEALAAVKQQTFQPGRTDGAPVPVQMVLPVTFRLNNASP